MNELTRKLLDQCRKVGYSKVMIGYPFYSAIIASNPKKKKLPRIKLNGALWAILEDLGISMGCGSNNDIEHYHQAIVKDLESGHYEYRRGKGWLNNDGVVQALDLDKVYCHCGKEAKIIQMEEEDEIPDVRVKSKTNLFIWPDKTWAFICSRCNWEWSPCKKQKIPTLQNSPEMNPGMLLKEVLRLSKKK